MRRWILRIAIGLILGAITTVAVAWGCAFHVADSSSYPWVGSAWRIHGVTSKDRLQVFFSVREKTGLTSVHYTWWSEPFPAPRDAHFVFDDVEFPRWSSIHRLDGDRSVRAFGHTEIAAGWPCRALLGAYSHPNWGSGDFQTIDLHNSIELGNRVDRQYGIDILPLAPLMPGFLIDTYFYAAIWLALFFGFTSTKRFIRTRRGRCPRCGYDVRGDLKSGCPECGWNRDGDSFR